MIRSRKKWLVVAGILALVLGTCASTYRKEQLAFCEVCGSRCHIEFRRLFSETGPKLPFSTDHEVVAESQLCRDYFQAGHAHLWEPAWTAVDGVAFFGFRATGMGHNSPLRRTYEDSPALREFVRRKVDAGDLTRRQVQLVFAESSTGRPSMGQWIDPPVLVKPEELALLASAQQVIIQFLKDSGETRAGDWIGALSDRQPPPR